MTRTLPRSPMPPRIFFGGRWNWIMPGGRLIPVISGGANATYDEYLDANVLGNPTHSTANFDVDTFRVIFLDAADHTTNLATDRDHADLTGAGIVATSGDLDAVAGTIASNVATVDSNDEVVPTVSGDQFEQVVFFKWSGASATSPLLFNYDTGTGLPFTPSGGDITVAPNALGWLTVDGTP